MLYDSQTPISVIIPYRRDGLRERIVQWVVRRYEKLLPNGEVILAEETKPLKEFFCRSQAINNGARSARNDVYLISDSDAVFFPDALAQGVQALGRGVSWVIPYKDYHELNKCSTERILRSNVVADPTALAVPKATYYTSNASLSLVTAENFWHVGGFDERFIGWAPEDQAWAAAMQTLLGEPYRITTRDMFHLWHPVRHGHRTDNPHYYESKQLWYRYRKANGKPFEMEKVINRW